MLPPIVEQRLKRAEAKASQLREAARLLTEAAQTIDEVVELTRMANWTAKLNHDTVADMAARRAL